MAATARGAPPPKHAWSLSDRPGTRIDDENEYLFAAEAVPVLPVDEAERYVESLKEFRMEDVGSGPWLRQHERLVRLNLQAHQNAMARTDEFVLEAIMTFDKIPVLVHELLLIEAWREFVFPRLCETELFQSGRVNMRAYFTLYHEATLTNLLEVVLYHRHVCEKAGELLVEVVDYAARRVAALNSPRRWRDAQPNSAAKEFVAQLAARTPTEELAAQADELDFRASVTAVAVLRFVCEHLSALPLPVATRVLDTHDILMGLIPLIENPPWTRRLPNGRWQKVHDFQWRDVSRADLLKVTRTEGQVWLALFHLVCGAESRRRYRFHSFRKESLLRVRKFVNEVLLDQLPVLADVQRFMDELAISDAPEPTQLPPGNLLVEQVPQVREGLLRGRDWDALAAAAIAVVFGAQTDATDADLRRIGAMYQEDGLHGLLEPLNATPSDAAGEPTVAA
ncbi:unnamed protein product, partial [Phaeothamnion confervicola]